MKTPYLKEIESIYIYIYIPELVNRWQESIRCGCEAWNIPSSPPA